MNRLLFAAMLRSFAVLLVVAVGWARAAPFAYITDSRVSVVDTATNRVVATIPVGLAPVGVAVSATGTRVYVTNFFSDSVSVIDAINNRVIATVPVASTPFGIAINPGDSRVYVGHLLETETVEADRITVIDTATHTVTARVAVGLAPAAVAIDPSGRQVFVANVVGNTLSVVDSASNEVVRTVPVGAGPLGLAIDPAGTRLYVTHIGTEESPGSSVSVIDMTTFDLIASIPTGRLPTGVAVNPSGSRVYVANSGTEDAPGNTISVIDTAANAVSATVRVGTVPQGISVHPSGTKVYVSNAESDSVSVIDAATNTVTATIQVGSGPTSFGNFVAPVAINTGFEPGVLSGLWWNPGESGWGIHFTQRGGTIFAAWYTYDAAGGPKWYVASNCSIPPGSPVPTASCAGMLYEVAGPAFFGANFNPAVVRTTTVGSLRVSFQDANRASMSYTVNGQGRTVSIARQVFQTGAPAPAVDYTDLWWRPSESGWGLAVTQQYGVMFLAWFVYDAAGKPVWYVASNCAVNAPGNACSGTLYRTTGPALGPTFNPAQVQVFAAGAVRLSFSDANNGTLTYTVDGIASSKAITRQLF